jgi:hypothetical protein
VGSGGGEAGKRGICPPSLERKVTSEKRKKIYQILLSKISLRLKFY